MNNDYIEHIESETPTAEHFINLIDYYLNDFMEIYGVDELRKESQNTFNACLQYIGFKAFKTPVSTKGGARNILPRINGVYDYIILNELLDYYIFICNLYSKEINIIGFCNLLYMNYNKFYEWGSVENATTPRGEIFKKLIAFRESSLSDKLSTGKINPVGTIAILNHSYGWNNANNNSVEQQTQPTTQLVEKYCASLTDNAKNTIK